MDENLPTAATGAQIGTDSFDIMNSVSDAANSIDADTFAFLVVPVGIVAIVTLFLVIFLAIRRRSNRRNFETLIDEEIKSSEATNQASLAETRAEEGGWTVPDIKEIAETPDLAQADEEEEKGERWQVAKDATEAGEDLGVDFEETPPSVEPDDVREIKQQDKADWLKRLRNGLSRTRDALSQGFQTIIGRGKTLDSKLLEQLHEQLYRADIGVKTCDRLVKKVSSTLGTSAEVQFEAVADVIRGEVSTILASVQRPLIQPSSAPWVILVVGVNGVGKTTTIGKLTARFLAEGKTVLLAAADTFRAAAIEQLQTWGERLGVDVIAHQAGADPAAVAFDAVKAAKARGHDVLIIDTAGRLHSKKELMDELAKIHRVIGRDCPGAPHETWLVIDATTGQNANMQVSAFKDVVELSGLVITKLDGTAKGGVVIGIADQHQIPIRFIGVGEKAADLREFSADDFAKTLI